MAELSDGTINCALVGVTDYWPLFISLCLASSVLPQAQVMTTPYSFLTLQRDVVRPLKYSQARSKKFESIGFLRALKVILEPSHRYLHKSFDLLLTPYHPSPSSRLPPKSLIGKSFRSINFSICRSSHRELSDAKFRLSRD
jgi:hypothetical protein